MRFLTRHCEGLPELLGTLKIPHLPLKSYFLRRLLLIPPTLLGITLLVFTVTRFVPGGPLDRMLQQAARGADQGGKKSSAASNPAQGGLSDEQLEELESSSASIRMCSWPTASG